MGDVHVWRVGDGRGGVREVPVRVEGRLLLVGPGPQPLSYASEEPPRLAVAHYAMAMRWPVAEILAPGEPSRAELTADLARLRAPLAGDLAAIEARAARFLADLSPDGHYTDGRRQVAASVGTLLAHLAAQQAAHAAALDAAVAAARAEALAEGFDIARNHRDEGDALLALDAAVAALGAKGGGA